MEHRAEERGASVPYAQQPWQALLDSAGEGLWGVDLNGNCTFVNQAALRMLGYREDEVLGQRMHELVHHHRLDGSVYPEEQCSVYRVFRQGETLSNAVEHVFRKDGELFWTEMSAHPIVDGGNVRGAVVMFRDMTKARAVERALLRSEKLTAVGQLASSIAHEINNPLESVTNLLYLMRTADDVEQVRLYASMAETELARVTDITIQTLRFHRQQAKAAPLDLVEVVPSILRLYTSRFASKNIVPVMRLRTTPPALVMEGDIRQVLNNLVRNALDAMPNGGKLHLRVRPGTCQRTGRPGVRVTIADTGTGILPRMRQHLFEPFYTSKEVTGTGLGLWICKGIVEKHRGWMQMRSRWRPEAASPLEPGYGTVFVLWLPLA